MLSNFSYVIDGLLAGSGRPGHGRELRSNLLQLHEEGIRGIVTLLAEGLPKTLLQETGLRGLTVSIPDFHPPTPAQIEKAVSFIDSMLKKNHPVLVHCGSGYGRTGTILTCYFVYTGMSAAEAIAKVRRKRPGSIETDEQEDAIRAYADALDREGM